MQKLKILTPIQKFYKDKSVFATGGTGYIGKVLLEKLLYACDVKNVYVLMLPMEKGMNIQQQVQNLSKFKLFSRIMEEKPHVMQKIIPVCGDLTAPSLGINDKDLDKLRNDVNVVFHAAAAIQFNREINSIIKLNMLGTKKIIDLAKEMKNLESMIYLSTAYSGIDQKINEERIYDWHQKPQDILQKCVEGKLEQSMIKPFANTYGYSKRLAEIMIREERGNLPITIVRPSKVTPTVKEPFPGWVDNYYHVISFINAGAMGAFRTGLIDTKSHIEYLPVDMVANAIISAAWHQGANKVSSTVPVYNLTCTEDSRITWGKAIDLTTKYVREYPFERIFLYPKLKSTKNETIYNIRKLLFQRFPALALDLFTKNEGKLSLKQIQDRQDKSMAYAKYSFVKCFPFTTEKLLTLYDQMSPEDRKLFNFITRNISGDEYIKDIVLGIRRYLLKQSDDTLPESRKKLFRLKVLDRSLKLVAATGVIWLLPIPWETILSAIF